MTTPNLNLSEWAAAQDQPHVTVNDALNILDAVVQLSVISDGLNTPPPAPSEGDRYIVAAAATGAWAGWETSIALYSGGMWVKITPATGWIAWVSNQSAHFIYNSVWSVLNTGGGGGGGGTASDNVLHCREELASGVRPMAGPAAVEDPRDINTVVRNSIAGATLTGNTIHLPEGIYDVIGDAAVYRVGRVRTSLYSVTNSSLALMGTNCYANPTDGAANAAVSGQIAVGAPGEDFQLTQYRQWSNSNDDQGIGNGFGGVEIYSQIMFRKVG